MYIDIDIPAHVGGHRGWTDAGRGAGRRRVQRGAGARPDTGRQDPATGPRTSYAQVLLTRISAVYFIRAAEAQGCGF